MKSIKVKDLAFLTYDEMMKNKTKYLVKFDDGVEKPLHASHVKLSWPYWAVTRCYSEVNIPSDLCYDYNTAVNDDTHKRLCSLAVKVTRDYPDIDKEDVWAIVYRDTYNEAFNLAIRELPAYANTIDFDSIMQIIEDPEIVKAMSNVTGTVESIDIAQNVIRKVTLGDKYPDNGICVTTKNKSVPVNQTVQMRLRGRTTEVNSVIFDKAITTGFGTGFTNIADFVKECTSATKSFVYNDGYIAASEYFSRKMQLLTSAITHLTTGDCGTDETLTIPVPNNKGGEVFLNRCIGSNIWENGKWTLIEDDRKDLLGKTIELRTAMSCRHIVDQGVCEMCYGDLAYNIAPIDSPGHVSCITVTERASQSILSVKHLDFIVWMFRVILEMGQRKMFEVIPQQPNRVYLRENFDATNTELRIARSELPHFTRLSYTNNLDMLEIGEISSISKYWIDVVAPDGECVVSDEFDAIYSGVPASLSVEFFRYLKRNPDYIIDDTNQAFISFRLDDFNKGRDGKPKRASLFEYQQRHESMPVYVENLENILRSSKATRYPMVIDYDGSSNEGCSEALMAVHTYLERKLPGTSITHIATILASLRRKSRRNPELVSGFTNQLACFDKHDRLMEERSFGPYLTYQEQNNVYYKVGTFITPYRHNSLLDNAVYIPLEE